MVISELYDKLPGAILSKRICREQVRTPQYTMFLLEPGNLDCSILYIIDSEKTESVLPLCTAPEGATVLCAGAVPPSMPYKTSINLISVDCGILELHNSVGALLSEERKNAGIDRERMRQKFSLIIDEKMLEDVEVESLCRSFPKKLQSSYCVIYVETELDRAVNYSGGHMRGDLEELFPEDNITIYDNQTVILHSYNGFTHPPKLPEKEFESLLQRYNAYAGISNGMRKPSKLKMMYMLAKRTMDVGKNIVGGKKRIFTYDDVMLESIIAYAATGFQQQSGCDDIVLMGNPMLSNLMKHDPNGKRELLETLVQYLINGKSIAKTAESMHMHRNTVQNRMAVIEEIIGDEFTRDGILQCKLLMSYYITNYYRDVMHRKLVLSPLCENADKIVSLP